jgi:hypothetical protein
MHKHNVHEDRMSLLFRFYLAELMKSLVFVAPRNIRSGSIGTSIVFRRIIFLML